MNDLTIQNEKTPQPVKYSAATVQTVRDTIFKGANDAELQLFFHKCLSVGCHPLDGLIHPSKFNDGQGGKNVVFLTTIDLFRARAQDTGEYDGQDEPEFEYDATDTADFAHPSYCRVNVYKKDVSRATVGTADWNEFYPQDSKKQFMWKKMPKVMLAKCAEAQGLRKAFPQALNKLYAEEEMMQAINSASLGGGSTKPQLTQATEIIDNTQGKNFIESVDIKTGKNTKGPWKKYGVKIDGVYYSTFSDTFGTQAQDYQKRGCLVGFESEKKGQYYNLTNLWEVVPAQKEKENAPVVEDSEDFKLKIRQLATKCGQKTDEDIDEYLTEHNFPVFNEVTAEQQNAVADMYIAESGPN